VAVGVLDMALWDAVAKIERKPLKQARPRRGCHRARAWPRVIGHPYRAVVLPTVLPARARVRPHS
jgi:hypothetical protein